LPILLQNDHRRDRGRPNRRKGSGEQGHGACGIGNRADTINASTFDILIYGGRRSFTQHLDKLAGHDTGAIEILGKPYDLDMVVKAVQKALPPGAAGEKADRDA
jgi:hypothetical protein